MSDDPNEGIPAGVDPVLLRFCTWQAVEAEPDEAVRAALTAALEVGDAGVYELDDDWYGVKVAGRQFARIHGSRLRDIGAN